MELHQISKHCYYSDSVKKGDQPIMGLIAGPCETLAVDCGNGPGRSLWLLHQAKKLDLPPVRYAVLTHWHWDHVMGGRAMQETDVTLLATQGTARQLEVMSGWQWSNEAIAARVADGLEIPFCQEAILEEYPREPRSLDSPLPDITINGDGACVHLDDVTVQLIPCPCDHSMDGMLVRVPEDGVVFVGDSLYLNMYQSPWHYTGEKLLPLLDTLEGMEADWYLPAHHDKPMTGAELRSFAARQRELCRLVGEDVTLQGAARRYAAAFGQEPDAEAVEELMAFVRGNIVQGR